MNVVAAMRRTLFLVELRESCRVRNAQISQNMVTPEELYEASHTCALQGELVSVHECAPQRMLGMQVIADTSCCVQMLQHGQEDIKKCCC